LGEGVFYSNTDKPLFGAMGDSAPDRWGRTLMRRAERRRALEVNETPRTLFEMDYLLLVDDASRQGAMRFSSELGGPFLAQLEYHKVPPLVKLPDLLSAVEHIEDERETAEELRLLLAPGSSLGGARPKASVVDAIGNMFIAKFPYKDDDLDVVLWEAIALTLAQQSGIDIPKFRVEKVGSKSVLLLKRFDRDGELGQIRVPFLSAMSMLDASDNEDHSYLEIVDAVRQFGSTSKEDVQQLWRRMVFSILISNTDDHLRNHGFLYQDVSGWRLSPAYDLNPVPVDIRPRILSTNISENDGTASLELAFEVASYFELSDKQAKKIAYDVGTVVSRWQDVAKSFGLSKSEIGRVSSAFEHEDLKVATKL
jgi:serine/threonine-protein kinase HipA